MIENLEEGKKLEEGVELKYYSEDEVVSKPNLPKPKTTIPQVVRQKKKDRPLKTEGF